MRQVVDTEGKLEAVACYPTLAGDGGVVNQQVDVLMLRPQPPGQGGNRRQIRQITLGTPESDYFVAHRPERFRYLAADSPFGPCDYRNHQKLAGDEVIAES